jgi:hypothetical protein
VAGGGGAGHHAALPFWGYGEEEAVPAGIDTLARGVVPIRVKKVEESELNDSLLAAAPAPAGRLLLYAALCY